MVRHYKRKTRRGEYGVDNINAAVAKVRSGEMSKRKAEAVYGVPRETLTRHMQGLVKSPGTLGRFKTVLSTEFEKALTEHAVHLQQMLFGLTTADFRKLAFEVAEKLNIEHPFNKDSKKAGRDWLSGFLSRHPELAVRHPEPTSMCRAIGFNKPNVDKFFNILKTELQKNSVTAERLWNADETGLTAVHRPGKIMAKSGIKQVGKITSGERGETVTAMCAVNAAGTYVPPLMIFKRRRMTELLLKGSPPGTIGAVTDNGWINGDVFLKWLKHFVLHVKPSAESKVVLVVDGHSTHKSLAAIDYARENNIVMICLPPHSTHLMQPLDKTIFGPLKTAYNAACDRWMVSHPGRRIVTYDQAELFCEAYLKAANMRNAINGFSSCGLWPFKPDVFTDEHFAPCMITDEPEPSVAAKVDQQPMNSEIPQSSSLARDVITAISPIPKAEKSRTRKRRAESAEVLTASPYKNMLLDKMCKGKRPQKRSKEQTSKSKKSNELVPKRKKKLICREDKPRGRPKQQKPSEVYNKKCNKNSQKPTSQRKRAAAARKEIKSGDIKSPCKCHGCGIVEFSSEDIQLNRGWIACKSCGIWFHDSCGEEHGVFDDEYYYCIECVD